MSGLSIRVALLSTFLLWSTPALATTGFWFGNYAMVPSTSATNFISPAGGGNGFSAGETGIGVCPTGLTLKSMKVVVNAAPDNGGGTDSWTITFRAGSTAAPTTLANKTLACTISEAATSCTDTDTTVIDAGVLCSVSVAPANTPAATNITWYIEYDTTTAGESVYFGHSGSNLSTTTTQFISIAAGANGPASAESARWSVIPGTFTAGKLCAWLVTTPGAGASRTFAGFEDGSAVGQPTVAFDEDDVGIECDNSTTNALTAGAMYSFQSTLTNSPAASLVSFGIVMTATTVGQFFIPSNHATVLNTGSANFTPFMGMAGSTTTADSTVPTLQNVTNAGYTISASYAKANLAPGDAKSWTIVLREAAANASVPFQIVITGAATTTGNASGTFTPTADALLNNSLTPAGTPTANTIMAISYLASTPQPGRPAVIGGGIF